MLSVCDNKKGNRLTQRIITLNCLDVFLQRVYINTPNNDSSHRMRRLFILTIHSIFIQINCINKDLMIQFSKVGFQFALQTIDSNQNSTTCYQHHRFLLVSQMQDSSVQIYLQSLQNYFYRFLSIPTIHNSQWKNILRNRSPALLHLCSHYLILPVSLL